MSLRYLLDGYNIVHQIQGLYLREPEEQRLELIRLIERTRPQGSLNNTVTIYFDGKPGYISDPPNTFIRVVFSQGESADDLIKNAVDEACNKKDLVVVSNDKDIRIYVRAQGARILSVREFLSKSGAGPQKVSRKPGKSMDVTHAKNISKTLEFQINQELHDLWIKKKKSP